MEDSALGQLWAKYDSLQKYASQVRKVDPKAWAIEEQLNDFLAKLEKGSLPVDDEVSERRLKNLLINRQKKHRHRSRLLQEHTAISLTFSPSESIIRKVIETELLVRVRTSTTAQEWRILVRLARGDDYGTVARSEGMSVVALKTKISRCRRRVRFRLAA